MKNETRADRVVFFVDGEFCEPSEEHKKECASLLQAYRAELDKRHVSNAENFDKAILTYSSAGLAFSVGMFKDFFWNTAHGFPFLLAISWLSFTSAIVMVGLSYLLSQKTLIDQLIRAERLLIYFDESARGESPWLFWSNGATLLAALLFTVGVVTTVWFPMVTQLSPRVSSETEKTKRIPLRARDPSVRLLQTCAGISELNQASPASS